MFFVEIELHSPPDSVKSPPVAPSYQSVRSQSRSRCDVSHFDDQDNINDDIEHYNEGVLVSSTTSSLSYYTKRKSGNSNKVNQPPLSSPLTFQYRSSPIMISYTINDVMLNNCVYTGISCQSTDNILHELNSKCQQILFPKTDTEIISIISNSLMCLKSINLIILDTDRNSSLTSSVLMAKLRKLGYIGFAVLLSSQKYPDTNERFLNCGGDGILWKPVTNIKAIQRVLIGKFNYLLFIIFIIFHFIHH